MLTGKICQRKIVSRNEFGKDGWIYLSEVEPEEVPHSRYIDAFTCLIRGFPAK
jgi:hypothetical protein